MGTHVVLSAFAEDATRRLNFISLILAADLIAKRHPLASMHQLLLLRPSLRPHKQSQAEPHRLVLLLLSPHPLDLYNLGLVHYELRNQIRWRNPLK